VKRDSIGFVTRRLRNPLREQLENKRHSWPNREKSEGARYSEYGG
jgi:hypothetical protein